MIKARVTVTLKNGVLDPQGKAIEGALGHLGFGGGVHACLGTSLARLACKISFEELLARYPDFARVEAELPWVPSSNFRSPMRLELAVA